MTANPVRIEKMVYGGDGLARSEEGQVLLLPFTLPEEVISQPDTEAIPESGISILHPSPDRVTPKCLHFGRCGGCQYQMANYGAQLKIKESILRESLEREDVSPVPAITVHGSPEPWGYRNRVRFRAEVIHGNFRLGYSHRASNSFLPVVMCPIAAPVLWAAAEAMMRIADAAPKFTEWLIASNQIEVSCDDIGTKVQVHLLCAAEVPRKPDRLGLLAEALKTNGIAVVSLAASRLHIASGRPKELLASWGAQGLSYQVADNRFWLTPGSFFQVNRYLIPSMVDLVCRDRRGTLAWDLYAGVGLFAWTLSRQFAAVTAVEANGPAVQELQRGLRRKGDRAIQETTVSFLRSGALQRERPNLIVLDPPRAGAGEEVCRLLLRIGPECIVYVSCEPTTLARDLRILTETMYAIAHIELVDLFPQTYHLETVIVLERKGMQAE